MLPTIVATVIPNTTTPVTTMNRAQNRESSSISAWARAIAAARLLCLRTSSCVCVRNVGFGSKAGSYAPSEA